MKKDNLNLGQIMIIIYAIIFSAFLIMQGFLIFRNKKVTASSNIPVLNISLINLLTKENSKKTVLPEPIPVNLSQFTFGATEPFNH